jgi:excisionase family DNA binding protein
VEVILQEEQLANEHSTQPRPNLADAPDVMTPVEAAKLLRIGRNAAYEGIQRGEIPSVKIGRRLLVPKAALQRMLDCETR